MTAHPAVLVDPRHDPASIARAAANVGARVHRLDDMPGPGPSAYDPLARLRTVPHPASDHPAITAAITIKKDSPK